MSTDWAGLVRRWDAQQERYLPEREQRLALMLDVIAHRNPGGVPRILDLCCGTGSISARLLERFPDASIVGVDTDPAHLELARRTLGDRVEWHDADLRSGEWADDFEAESFDAVVSATAIHWFQPEEIVLLYRELVRLLRRQGAFVNADHLPVGSPRVAALAAELLENWRAERLADAEDYYAFRDALRDEPELRPLVEEGDRRFQGEHPGTTLSVEFHREALVATGSSSWRSAELSSRCYDAGRPARRFAATQPKQRERQERRSYADELVMRVFGFESTVRNCDESDPAANGRSDPRLGRVTR